jgi:hypothetical protein
MVWAGFSLFAADFSLSAGGGGLLGYTFTRYTLKSNTVNSSQSMDRFDYAGFLFFDATYAEFAVLLQGGTSTYREIMPGLTDNKGTGRETSVGFSLLGKYPFTVNKSIVWFPMLGIEYQIALVEMRTSTNNGYTYNRTKGKLAEDKDKDGNPYPLSAWNSWWIDVGAGLDYDIPGPLFVRGEFLFGFRLPTEYEMGALDMLKRQFIASNGKLAGLTGSPSLKIGLGYRF